MAVAGAGSHENWSSRMAFIFAAVGSAVGLGNIWKFPYEAGEGGGGAFVLIYLAFVFGIGVPVMIAELSIGRRGHLSPPNAAAKVAEESRHSRRWSVVGWMGVVGAFLVLSFYSVIAGVTFSYMVDSLLGNLAGLDGENSAAYFGAASGNGPAMIAWHAGFMAVTIFIVARGIQGGLERAVTILMPILFLLLLALVIYGMSIGDAGAALNFLFMPDFSEVTLDTVLQALGQAFFSLSLALGAIMTYGAYVPRDVSLTKSAFIIAGADTMVAILAGLMIFPIVFEFGLEPGQGMGLIFVTLPVAFAQIPGGAILGAAFFLLLGIAALTSGISLLEPLVSWLEEHKGISRRVSAVVAGLAIFVLGIGAALSFGDWSDVTFWQGTVLDNLDFVTNNIIMPLGGLLIALFVGWMMTPESVREELPDLTDKGYTLYRRAIMLVCPVALMAIFFAVSGADIYVLQLLALAGYGIADDPAIRMAHATAVAIIVFVPTLLALHRHHPKTGLLFFTNLVAGWTPVGWIFCLYWSHRPDLMRDGKRENA